MKPKLRFKEFSGDWESKKLGEVCDDFIVPMRDKPKIFSGTIPWCKIDDISGKYINGTKSNKYVSKETIKNMNLKVNPVGTVICSCSASIGCNAITTVPLITNQTFIGIVCKENLNNEYLYYLMGTKKSHLEKIAGGTTIPYISRQKFEQLKIKLPSLKEQEKIASFLSLVDERINLQNKKVEALKEYKKGVMQKIFKKELRFKDDNGNDYPDWEEKKLGEILKEVSEKTKENNKYAVISSTTKGLFLQNEYFNKGIASNNNIGYKILKINQVVLSPQNLWLGNINFNEKYNVGIVSPSYKVFDINNNFNKKYIAYMLKTPRAFYEFGLSSEQGASIVRRNLNLDLFYEISFKVPTFDEQIKISSFLSLIDEKIEKETKKLNLLNDYKKGLLQKMFV